MENLRTTRWELVAVFVAALATPARTAEHGAPSITPADALRQLTGGTGRFVSGKPSRQHQTATWRAGLREGQHPFAVVLGCSDSRVPVELVFDEGFGQLFVVRVAGNVAGDDERGSIEYSVNHLHVPLIVVLGHEQCGAVTAALGSEADRKAESADIQTILGRIEPALKEVPGDASAADRLHRAVEANVRSSAQQLRTAPGFQDRISRGELDIVGGVYELETGRVRWLDR